MKSIISRLSFIIPTLLAAAAWPHAALAQVYPTQPIKLVIPFAPGGAGDTVGKLMAERLSSILKQPVTVENRLGRGGAAATEQVAKAAPDGYTLLYATNGTLVTSPIFLRVPGYDPLRSVVPVSLISLMPAAVSVNSNVRARTLQDLLELIKSTPGRYRYATAGAGTTSFLVGELFKSQTGLDVREVAFKGPSAAVQGVIAGDADILFEPAVFVASKAKDGLLRPLAVMGHGRYPQLKDVPTASEAGAPELIAYVWAGLVVPHGTAAETVDVLNRAVQQVLSEIETMATFQKVGMHAEGSTPQQFHDLIRRDLEKWSRAIPLSATVPN